jgi:molybdopterin-guanine dinucleotide biosynthesis protein A
LDGKTLLERAIEAVAEVCAEVVVAMGPDAKAPLASLNVRVVREANAFRGPLAGTLTGLHAAATPLALVVGGDMPTLVPSVLRLLLERLATTDANAAILGSAGRRQTLPLALRREPAVARASELLDLGERSLQALVDELGALTVEESEWRELDPGGETLRDIDRPEDLLQRGAR